jgi:hydroxyacylglutathione hydrolase
MIAIAGCLRPATRVTPVESGRLATEWYAGGAQCVDSSQFRVSSYNQDFLILRQAACTNYEKPFLYLIVGSDRALLLDTGAGGVDLESKITALLRDWQARSHRPMVSLIVAHSHAHGDHVAADSQFVHRANTVVVGRDTGSVRAFFGIAHWPADTGTIDLGDRVLDILPIPGHQPASIAVYDRRTGILLTGDTFYPGRLYVRDTAAFAVSIHRLADFARKHHITHMLGAHVEETRTPFRDYPIGTKDQPEEHDLDLQPAQLFELDSVVQRMRGKMTRTVLKDFTVWPQP